MADVKITDLPASSGLALTDLIEVVDDPGGTPESQKATFTQVGTVLGSSATPQAPGSAAAGSSVTLSRADHVHPAQSVPSASSATPQALGSAAAGASTDYSRADHVHAMPNAADVGAASTADLALKEAKIKTTQFLSTYPGSFVAASTNGKRTFCSVAGGADFGLGIQDDCVIGHEQWIMRAYTGTTDPGGSVIVVDAGSDTHIIGGTDRIDTAFRWMCLRCYAYDGDTNTRYWTFEEEALPIRPTVRAAHTASTLTLTPDYGGAITPLDATSNAIAVTIPAALFLAGAGVAGGAPARAFRSFHRITSVAGGALSFAGSGGIVLTYHGKDPAVTPFAAGDLIEILVTSATSADVITRPVGDPAQATATDALYPLVQTAHTASTKTLAAGDAGDIIPLNGASNAIAVTIPHTLFAAGGTGRAWVCQAKVTSVAGGALTFVGSGGIVVNYSGKKPSATPYAAGDWLTICVDSATTATIFCASVIP